VGTVLLFHGSGLVKLGDLELPEVVDRSDDQSCRGGMSIDLLRLRLYGTPCKCLITHPLGVSLV
jgi:hypothetical protein